MILYYKGLYDICSSHNSWILLKHHGSLFYSYDTLVGVVILDTLFLTDKKYSNTTSRHIQAIITKFGSGKKVIRLSPSVLRRQADILVQSAVVSYNLNPNREKDYEDVDGDEK